MGILTSKLNRLQARGQKAVELFTKTVSDLKQVNTEIESEQQRLRDKIVKHELEHGTLEDAKLRNLRLADNIEKLLN